MPLSSFHPVIAHWFEHRFGAPTAPQRAGWEAIRAGRDTLISAPTGSGKTLAAFLHALDQLFREGLEHPLPDETRVIYVSPLKALSADIHLNLAEPRREIRRLAEQELGENAPRITAAIRSGDTPAAERAAMIDAGHRRKLDLALELPNSPLEAVMSGEVWDELYDRLTELIKAHKTTIVFVNTRRLAERVARHLAERLGEEAVTAHHGSLSKESRLDAEERLKTGKLRALVATASLELGIDIGHVDLVCQLGTPRRISAFLQRVGRSGHTVHGTPKGRLFPLTRDELVECTALLRSVEQGKLDRIAIREKPIDVLSQQIVAEVVAYLSEAHRMLGALPTQDTIILERFFDESGGMQLVLHAPFGSRINRAWGLALRKKFCQGFNFELQAAATEEGIILSLGSQHSFPLEEVFRYLHPNTVHDTLEQALLQSPIFETRWRWSTTLALAVPRNRGGARVPNQLQRMYAEDLLQAVFPDAAACQDNLPGAREIPEHPLVGQAMRDALEEAVDLHGLEAQLRRLYAGEIATVARDTPEPSVLCHELLNSAVYTFLDDAPLEERRTRAVYTRRATEARSADDLGALDPEAIRRVREEAWPVASTPDEMYDALMVAGYIKQAELAPHWDGFLTELGERV